ncbi:hypothetical protein A2961_00910 [Candidatus Woesebacteria bacterium RIFCSPLOWO2_01_FULL_39_21]|uniref:Cohesin domain-containing protein n=1 Tax=Candidatus Woesebacteria bacterium RIFCSPLOWO2_01_FULL_39_21 TaxID=1802519 RepID=A0A1F8BG35_9BACT|nr:MAG: hypothetical protein A2961_00910 [Candidatus Woesebacteria bacterium RIFCSPLOWO2_01_FULL_39_21]
MKKIFNLITFVTLSLVFFNTKSNVWAQTGSTVSVQPATQTKTHPSTVTVNINITNAQNLGAFDIILNYSSSLLKFETVSVNSNFMRGPGSGGSYRTVTPTGPIPTVPTGSFMFGAFTMDTTGLGLQGPSGNGTLATITFSTVGANGTSNITLSTVDIYDINGSLQTRSVQSGSVTVVGGSGTPAPTPTPTPTSTPSGSPTPTSTVKPTKTPKSTPVGPLGDADCDKKVNWSDYYVWLAFYGKSPQSCPNDPDFDNDNDVDLVDYSIWVRGAETQPTATPVPTGGDDDDGEDDDEDDD